MHSIERSTPMKFNRLIALALALVLAVSLFACGAKPAEPSQTPAPASTAPVPSDSVVSDSDLEPYPGLDDPSIASDSDLNPN